MSGAGLWQRSSCAELAASDKLPLALPRARPWTYSNTRASSSSPSTASPCPTGKPRRRPSTTPSPPPSEIGYPCVVKAQVPIGKRGKAGGIKVAKDDDEARAHSEAILGMDIRGFTVHDLWIEEASDIDAEYYASIILDRSEKKLLAMLSRMGGMDVEEIAETDPDALVKRHIEPGEELDHRARPRDRARRRDRRGRRRPGRRDAGQARRRSPSPRTRR